MPASQRPLICRAHDAIRGRIIGALSDNRATAAASAWRLWEEFCDASGLRPGLGNINDKVPWLLIFGELLYDGTLAPKGKPISARHAEDYLRHVGQAFSSVGALDPRKDVRGCMDFRINRTIRAWKKGRPPSKRKKPCPREVLDALTNHALNQDEPDYHAISDLVWIAVFYLLRPSEYLSTGTTTGAPFTLADVIFRIGGRDYSATTVNLADLARAEAVGLIFTEQKNGITGETIWLTRAPSHYRCPVGCLIRRVTHLRQHGCTGTTPIFVYFDSTGKRHRVTALSMTTSLRFFAQACHLEVDVTVGALRCTGASALLNAGVPKELIQLVGRWRSDEVFRYLHTQSTTLMEPFATAMITGLR